MKFTGTLPLNKIWMMMAAAAALTFLFSCGVVPKDYPNKPFVYETNINVIGDLDKDQENELESSLENQLDDSMRVRTVRKFFYHGFNRPVLENPPVYDSTNAERSISFMRALLHVKGYLRDSISYDTTMEVKADAEPPQYRTIVNFNVYPGKLFLLDSVTHVITHPGLQNLTDSTIQQSFIKPGDPFSKQLISQEMDRLVTLYRNNGYLKMGREELIAIWDTLDASLLIPATDPVEQILQLQKIQERMERPTANVEIRLKPGFDSSKLVKYFVGQTNVFPEYSADTLGLTLKRLDYNESYDIYYYRNLFKPRFLAQNIYFKRGDLYDQQQFFKTITRFNTMGAWRLVNIEQLPRANTDSVDFNIYLTPAEKYTFILNLEGSRNSNFILQESLLGVGVNAQLLNRNFGRSSNQTNLTFRYGTELATKGDFVRSKQVSVGYSIFFPKAIPNFKVPEAVKENFRTTLAFSSANINRKDFFDLNQVNASWGYDFQWKKYTWTIKFPNIEYTLLNEKQGLRDLIDSNPSLRTVFNENGLVLSTQLGFSRRGGSGRKANVVRLNYEWSGFIPQFGLKIFDSIFKFHKIDLEYIRSIDFGKKILVTRLFGGIGIAQDTRTRKDVVSLPFFKQYFAGGPNSMRAWGLRTLGPGYSLRKDRDDNFRFGDIQFEANVELRFPLANIYGVRVNSAAFTDIGNVWFRNPTPDFPNGSFTFRNFYRDLGVGIGTGLRIDFSFFLLRLDYAVKVKNPSPYIDNPGAQGKWFYNFNPFNGILQLGINYPFLF